MRALLAGLVLVVLSGTNAYGFVEVPTPPKYKVCEKHSKLPKCANFPPFDPTPY